MGIESKSVSHEEEEGTDGILRLAISSISKPLK
jgi:hypothetical protein